MAREQLYKLGKKTHITSYHKEGVDYFIKGGKVFFKNTAKVVARNDGYLVTMTDKNSSKKLYTKEGKLAMWRVR